MQQTHYPALAAIALTLSGQAELPDPPSEAGLYRVLVFSRTEGFNHGAQITAGTAAILQLGLEHGFLVDTTVEPDDFTPENLAQYAVVVFLNTTGDVLDPPHESAFEAYIGAGGGYVGVHSATDTEYGWPFYGALVGAWFANHPAIQTATVEVVDPDHRSTMHLPASFEHEDEWYNFQSNPTDVPGIDVLLQVDETTYSGGTMGRQHPISWAHEFAGGRAWYTAMGHTVFTYSEPFFRGHLLGGIEWAAGLDAHSGDVNGDGSVDVADLVVVITNWGSCPPAGGCPGDADGDGVVGVSDLVLVIVDWS